MKNPEHRRTGIPRLVQATRSSLSGLLTALRTEEAFRQEVLLAVVLIPVALILGESGVERAVLIGAVLALLVVELLNSGIEATVDRVSLETHPLSGRAKDYASAAVSLTVVTLIVVWGLVLLT